MIVDLLGVVQAQVPAVVSEHIEGFGWILGIATMAVLAYVTYVAKKMDRNQSRLFELYDSLSKQVYTLQGEHNARVCNKDKSK